MKYITSTAIGLDVPLEEVKSILFEELFPEGIIDIRGEGDSTEFRIQEPITPFIVPPFGFGAYELINRKGLSQEQVIKIMNNLSELVRFHYHRTFEPDIGILKKLRTQSHNALKSIRSDEKIFFHRELGIPREYEEGFPTFVSEEDPRDLDHVNSCCLNLLANFPYPERAFQIGFDCVEGYIILDKKYKLDYGECDSVGEISIDSDKKDKGSWSLNLKNGRYDVAIDGSVAYQQATGRYISIVKKKIEETLK